MTRRARRVFLLGAILLPVCLIAACALWLRARLAPDRLREDLLAAAVKFLPPSTARVEVGSVSFGLGAGLDIRDLSIHLPSSGAAGEPAEFFRASRIRIDLDTAALAASTLRADSISIEGAVLTISQDADGAWSAPKPILDWLLSPHADAAIPTLSVSGASVRCRLQKPGPGPLDLQLDQLDGALSPGAREGDSGSRSDLRFSLNARGCGFEAIRLFGRLEGGRLRMDRIAGRLDLAAFPGSPIERLLPDAARTYLREHPECRIAGKVDLAGGLALGPRASLEQLQLAVHLSQGELDPPVGTFPLRSISGRIGLERAGQEKGSFRVSGLRGLTPTGAFAIDGGCRWASEAGKGLQLSDFELSASASPLVIADLQQFLPQAVNHILDLHKLKGALGLEVSVRCAAWPPALEDIEARVRPIDMQAAYALIPYPLDGISQGEIVYAKNKVTITRPVIGRGGTSTVEGKGEITPRGGRKSDGQLFLKIRGVTLDKVFRDSLPAMAQPIYDDFQVSGRADGEVDIHWTTAVLHPTVIVSAKPQSVKFRYKRFPVNVEQLEGDFILDIFEHQVQIPRLRGRHVEEWVSGSGTVTFAPPPLKLDLRIESDQLSLDSEILAALPEEVRRQLVANRVSGKAGLDLRLSTDADGHVHAATSLAAREVILHPPSFPLPLLISGGAIDVEGKNLRFRDLQGNGAPKFRINGELREDQGDHQLELDGEVSDFEFSERNTGFLPEAARKQIHAMELTGQYDFKFSTSIAFPGRPETPRRFSYRVPEARLRGAGINSGIRLAKVDASLELEGGGVLGGEHHFTGKAALQSARFNRLKFENAVVHFAYGVEHPAIAASRAGKPFGETDFIPGPDFTERLKAETLRHTLQVSMGPAGLFGGKVSGFLYADLGELHDMRGDFRAEGIDLGKTSVEVFETAAGDPAAGVGSGQVQFRGITGSAASILGVGKIQVTGANFASIPLFSQVFELAGGTLSYNALESQFSIKDEQFQTTGDNIIVRGPGLNLRGIGTMSFYETLDMSFVPEVFDLKIPIKDTLKRQVAQIRLTGSLQHPQAEMVFGGVVPLPLGGSGSPP